MKKLDIIGKFRLPRHVIFNVCDHLNIPLDNPSKRSRHALPTSLQVVISLRFHVSGSFQGVTVDIHRVSIASVSRVGHSASYALV